MKTKRISSWSAKMLLEAICRYHRSSWILTVLKFGKWRNEGSGKVMTTIEQQCCTAHELGTTSSIANGRMYEYRHYSWLKRQKCLRMSLHPAAKEQQGNWLLWRKRPRSPALKLNLASIGSYCKTIVLFEFEFLWLYNFGAVFWEDVWPPIRGLEQGQNLGHVGGRYATSTKVLMPLENRACYRSATVLQWILRNS